MAQIGRKIYYLLNTGEVILDTGERQGQVVDTTIDQDFQNYSALKLYSQLSVGCIELPYGQDSDKFGLYPYHVDVTQNPAVIVWDTSATNLPNAQSEKIAQLRTSYMTCLAQGFETTVGGQSYTFGWQSSDESNLNALETSLSKNFLQFPVLYADVHGMPVTIPDQATLDSIEQVATLFAVAQHQQILTLVSEVNNAQDVPTVNAIQWTPAPYTAEPATPNS